MDPSIAAQYGALGTLTLAATTVAAILWKRLISLQDKFELLANAHALKIETIENGHAEEIKTLTTEHKAEMKAMIERLMETNAAETREYRRLTENLTAVLDSMGRKFESKPSRRPGG